MNRIKSFENLTKLFLAVLFFLCLLHMTYSYYQAVRFIGMFGFIVLAFLGYQKKQSITIDVVIFLCLALLFQPFIKISLGRTGWNITDVIVGLGLLISIFKKQNKIKE